MFIIFDWGFRLALVLPWLAIVISALALLVPRREETVQRQTTRVAA
jgi:hypothetical protein